MPRLVDTTIRLLGQPPLEGAMPTVDQLRLAEILDGAGFAYLEISGGGCFDAAVRQGLESPWERIRAIRSRTTTPLAMALRGRLLVGSRPVPADLVRRFVASAAESGIDVFRLHDPLNDVSNLQHAAAAITEAGREFDGGLVYSPGPSGELDTLVEQARRLSGLGAARVVIHDATGSLQPHRARELVEALAGVSGLPVGFYSQSGGGPGFAAAVEAARAGADLIATSVYPVALALQRVSGETLAQTLAGLGLDTGVDVASLWAASDLVDEHLADEPVAPLAPRIATLAARHLLPPGLVRGLDANLRGHAAEGRLEEVLDELTRIRAEVGWPPLAAPIGQILASQALVHTLSAQRYKEIGEDLDLLVDGAYGTGASPVDPVVRAAVAAAQGGAAEPEEEPSIDELALRYEGLASSEEELLLLALFGEAAESLLEAIRSRARGEEREREPDLGRTERIREIVEIVQETGVGEVTIEDEGMRVTVRRAEERQVVYAPVPAGVAAPDGVQATTAADGIRVEAPMVGTFYRAPQPGAPVFVDVGDRVEVGTTLCILEAMKLMNEVKAEAAGVVRRVCVENAQPVEYGQLLFELAPVAG